MKRNTSNEHLSCLHRLKPCLTTKHEKTSFQDPEGLFYSHPYALMRPIETHLLLIISHGSPGCHYVIPICEAFVPKEYVTLGHLTLRKEGAKLRVTVNKAIVSRPWPLSIRINDTSISVPYA